MTHLQIPLHGVTIMLLKKLYIGLGLGIVELYLYSFNCTESKVLFKGLFALVAFLEEKHELVNFDCYTGQISADFHYQYAI